MAKKSTNPQSLSIILPTYDERRNIRIFIPQLVECFTDIDHEIIVVDDSSPDGTGEEVLTLAREFPQVRLCVRHKKSGVGGALRYGYNQAVNDIILSVDSDLSFATDDLMKLYTAIINGNDLVVGSRHSPSSFYETPRLSIWLKYIASRFGNALLCFVFRIPVRDFSVNCRAITRMLWKTLDTKENTNFFLFEMIFLAKERGARISQVPVSFKERRYGHSKISHIVEIPKAFYKMIIFLLQKKIRKLVH